MCAAIFLPLSMRRSAATTMAEPPSMAEREPNVPMPCGHEIAVAVGIADALGVEAELFREDLLERRAVALAVIHAAGDEHHRARGIEADFRMLVIAAAGRGDGGGDAAAQELAALARLGAAPAKPDSVGRASCSRRGSWGNRRCHRSGAAPWCRASPPPGSCCGGAAPPDRCQAGARPGRRWSRSRRSARAGRRRDRARSSWCW